MAFPSRFQKRVLLLIVLFPSCRVIALKRLLVIRGIKDIAEAGKAVAGPQRQLLLVDVRAEVAELRCSLDIRGVLS